MVPISYVQPISLSIPRSRTLPGGGTSWAYLPYSPLERESKVECTPRCRRVKRNTSEQIVYAPVCMF